MTILRARTPSVGVMDLAATYPAYNLAMTSEELRARLTFDITMGELRTIRNALRRLPSAEVFHLLFPIATDLRDGADYLAAALLLDLEPPCPLTCEDALRLLAVGAWQPSDTLVPLYLVCEFGKRHLLEAERKLSGELKGQQARYVETVGYWVRTLRVTEMADDYLRRWQREWWADDAHIWHHKLPTPAKE